MKSMGIPLHIILVFFTLSYQVGCSLCQLGCRDENNQPVDWYVMYKIPKIKGSSNALVSTGQAYAYITSASDDGKWTLSELSINNSKSPPGNTLSPLYKSNSEERIYITYNDQPPKGDVSYTSGHTKGVVMAKSDGGFWLVHSVPHYPPDPNYESGYSYPKTGLKNGQSYLCITLPPKDMETVGTQLMFNNPKVYSNYSSKTLQQLYPNLTLASWGKEVRKAPWQHEDTLTTCGGTKFRTFAKAAKFSKDLYKDWVASSLQADLLVETWPNGPGRLNSSCQTTYKVENIDSIKVASDIEDFSSHKDHSKWAIAFAKEKPWVCIGDINRAESQKRRGGGTVCMQNQNLWLSYYTSVKDIEVCPIPKGFVGRMYDKFKSFVNRFL